MKENQQIEFDFFPTDPPQPPKSAGRFRNRQRDLEQEFDFSFDSTGSSSESNSAAPDVPISNHSSNSDSKEADDAIPPAPADSIGDEPSFGRETASPEPDRAFRIHARNADEAAPTEIEERDHAFPHHAEDIEETNSEASEAMPDSDFEPITPPNGDFQNRGSIADSNSSSPTRPQRQPQFIHPAPFGSPTESTASRAPRSNAPERLSIKPQDTLGEALAEARSKAGMSIQDVADATKIRIHYLKELEANELQKRLPMVFVSAYVRTLCDTYRLDDESKEMILQKRRELSGETESVPRQLIDELDADKLVNAEEEKRVRRLFIMFGVGFALFVILVAWGLVALLKPDAQQSLPSGAEARQVPAENPGVGVSMSETDLECFITPEEPHTSVLKMSASPALDR